MGLKKGAFNFLPLKKRWGGGGRIRDVGSFERGGGLIVD